MRNVKVSKIVSPAMVLIMAGCSSGEPSGVDSQTNRASMNPSSETVSTLLASGLNASDPALKGMTRLTGEEISQLVLGRMLVEDRREAGGMPYPQSERFLPEGRVVIQLDRFEADGTYTIRSDALCVQRTDPQRPSCRAIYKSRDGRLFQAFYGPAGKITPILVNP